MNKTLTLEERWAQDDKDAPLFMVDGKLNVVKRVDKPVRSATKAFNNLKRLKSQK
jgi:hypothetical protein